MFRAHRPASLSKSESLCFSGTTGLHLWPAALKLIDYLGSSGKWLDNK